MNYKGSCHCGAIQFEVEAPEDLMLEDCNCSICTKSGFLHLIVPKSAFHLISGEDNLSHYRFNTGIAQHYFCKTCGIKPYYVPRSNPDGYDINAHCLDTKPRSITITPFDGQNWEDNAHQLSHKSQDQE